MLGSFGKISITYIRNGFFKEVNLQRNQSQIESNDVRTLDGFGDRICLAEETDRTFVLVSTDFREDASRRM